MSNALGQIVRGVPLRTGRARGGGVATGSLIVGFEEYWPLNEASGSRTGAHAGIVLADNNTVTSAAGFGGTAASFASANSESLSKTDVAALSFANESFTLFLWVNASALGSERWLIGKWDAADAAPEYGLFYDTFGGGRFRFLVIGPGGFGPGFGEVDLTSPVPATSTDYFLCVWHDAANDVVRGQVNNGSVISSPAYALGCNDGAQPFCLGAKGGSANFYSGLMAGVGVVRRVLTSTERTYLYNGGSGPRAYAAISAASP
jgi:hypothetical protein